MEKWIVVLSDVRNQCVSFVRSEDPIHYVGYRLVEGEPLLTNQAQPGYENQPRRTTEGMLEPEKGVFESASASWLDNWLTTYREEDPQDPYQLTFRTLPSGGARCTFMLNEGKQEIAAHFQPEESGIAMTMKLSTQETIKGAFSLQQCLRYTGDMNAEWRRNIARTPFLSELDMQAMGNANQTLTYARQAGRWMNFPVQYSLFETSAGRGISGRGDIEVVDHGLIARETPAREYSPDWYWDRVAPGATWIRISSGMYWQRTAMVSNRHPADCTHAWVDFGPLEAGQSRVIQGKFYFIEGTKEELLVEWQQDFPR